MKRAVFAGSFSPVTIGHLDVIKRSALLFDELIIAVTQNTNKTQNISLNTRKELLTQATSGLKNVQVKSFDGLLADFCKCNNADCIVKSVRNYTDFEYETEMAVLNKKQFGIETLLMVANPEYKHVSSSAVRELLRLGANIDDLVPKGLSQQIKEAIKNVY